MLVCVCQGAREAERPPHTERECNHLTGSLVSVLLCQSLLAGPSFPGLWDAHSEWPESPQGDQPPNPATNIPTPPTSSSSQEPCRVPFSGGGGVFIATGGGCRPWQPGASSAGSASASFPPRKKGRARIEPGKPVHALLRLQRDGRREKPALATGLSNVPVGLAWPNLLSALPALPRGSLVAASLLPPPTCSCTCLSQTGGRAPLPQPLGGCPAFGDVGSLGILGFAVELMRGGGGVPELSSCPSFLCVKPTQHPLTSVRHRGWCLTRRPGAGAAVCRPGRPRPFQAAAGAPWARAMSESLLSASQGPPASSSSPPVTESSEDLGHLPGSPGGRRLQLSLKRGPSPKPDP